ncbi:MAG: type I restriction enzyme HsdR N-terminal domain-containing protein [Truepera sp.]|nr:type I restriction enzyme HsdR N-terminal domain-containing protein [Truepera sp.]
MQDFKDKLVAFSKDAVTRAERVTSEEAAKQYLILPFFQFLGYDPLDPDEVVPEVHASFSGKFKNKVDYAICIDREPVIGVECKKTGELATADKGEIRGYFNAVSSIKLGILTDGLVYELYSDTDSENMMDENPFVQFNLANVAQEQLNDQVTDALWKLRKGTFDPADVGADAKRKIYIAQYIATLNRSFENPSDTFVRALMDLAGVEGRKTTKLREEHEPMIQESLQLFLDQKILERVGFASRQDLVKVQQAQSEQPPTPRPELPDWVALSKYSPPAGTPCPAAIRFWDGSERRLKYWYEVLTLVVEKLHSEELLTVDDAPIPSSAKAYMVNTEPVHPTGKPFGAHRRIDGTPLFVNVNLNAGQVRSNTKTLLQRYDQSSADVYLQVEQ